MNIRNFHLAYPQHYMRLSNIPVNQVFSGSFVGANSGIRHIGVFLKTAGPSIVTGAHGRDAQIVVVRLDNHKQAEGFINLFLRDAPVDNYRALEVELRILGATE